MRAPPATAKPRPEKMAAPHAPPPAPPAPSTARPNSPIKIQRAPRAGRRIRTDFRDQQATVGMISPRTRRGNRGHARPHHSRTQSLLRTREGAGRGKTPLDNPHASAVLPITALPPRKPGIESKTDCPPASHSTTTAVGRGSIGPSSVVKIPVGKNAKCAANANLPEETGTCSMEGLRHAANR